MTIEGLARAWRQVWPPAVICLGLVLVLARTITLWTIPLAGVLAGTLAWSGWRLEHAGLRELARYVVGFVSFTALRHIADDLGPPAYVHYPIVADRFLALGALPNVVAQATFPYLIYPSVVVYTSYFFVPPLAIALIWRCWPDRLRPYVSATLALFVLSAAIHVALPTAPPWIAAQMGAIEGVRPVVLDYYQATLPTAYQFGTGVSSNMVAAMPSVHLGVTTLIACALWATPLRGAALAYLGAMSMAVVFSGDHYLVDIIAGVGLAIGCWRWARSGGEDG